MSPSDQNELETTDKDEINYYKLMKWKTLRSASEQKFKELLERAEFESTFDNDFILAVAERCRELQRARYRFSALLFFLVLLMGAIGAEEIQHVSLLGIKISEDSPALGILLLITSILMFFVTVVSFTTDSYEDTIKTYIEVKQPDEVSKLYSLRFGWSAALFFSEANRYSYRFPANVAILGSAMLIIASAIIAVSVVGLLQYYLFINSIILVHENAQLPGLVNVPIVVVATCAITFSICAVVVKVPLPYWDYSNLQRLSELEEKEPQRAREIRKKIAQIELEKEKRNIEILQMIVVLFLAIVPQVALTGDEFFSEFQMLAPLLSVPILTIGVVSPLLNAFERRSFLAHCNAEDTPVKKYVNWKRRMLLTRMIVCCVVGIGLFVLFRQAS